MHSFLLSGNISKQESWEMQITEIILQPPTTDADKEELYKLKTCKRTQKSITPMNFYIKNLNEIAGNWQSRTNDKFIGQVNQVCQSMEDA